MSVQIAKEKFEKLKEKVEEMEEIISMLFDKELMESLARGIYPQRNTSSLQFLCI